MRPILLTLFALCGLLAHGYDCWYDTPRTIPGGRMTLGCTEGKTVALASVQIRATSKAGLTSWGLVWDMTDSLSFTRARLTVPDKGDNEFGSWYGLVVERVDSGRVRELYKAEPTTVPGVARGFNTLKLISDDPIGHTARLYAGNEELVDVTDVTLNGGAFALWVEENKKLKVQRICLELDTVPLPVISPRFESWHKQNIAGVEGEWEFLDREVKNENVNVGGAYRLRIVPCPDGYEMLYLGGADVNEGIWKPGCVKGLLKPSAFRGDYDLVWYDAIGREIKGEQNAVLSADDALLQLNFPLAKTSLRFRRLLRSR